MLPFLIEKGTLPFKKEDYLFIPNIRKVLEEKRESFEAYVVTKDGLQQFKLSLGNMTDEERQIILKGCLINYNRKE